MRLTSPVDHERWAGIAGHRVAGVGFHAVATHSPNSLIQTGPTDRRPAIWPWLVMPLVTLALFCALYKLRLTQESILVGTDPPAQTATPADSDP